MSSLGARMEVTRLSNLFDAKKSALAPALAPALAGSSSSVGEGLLADSGVVRP